jgi:hypothetical protein
MMQCSVGAAAALLFIATPCLQAEDTDEVKRLKERIEILQTKLELAEKQNELLQKEIEMLKSGQPTPAKTASKKSLSDRLPDGTVISGVYRQFGIAGKGEIAVTITGREGNKVVGTTSLKFTNPAGKETLTEGNVEGAINGVLLTLKTVGGSRKVNMTLTLKGDALEGTWSSSTGAMGAVGFKLAR